MDQQRARWRSGRVIAALLLAVLAAALVAGARWALDPARLRAEAETRLSALLGEPVAIDEVRVSLWPRPELVGSGIRIGEAQRLAPAVHAARVRLVPRPGPLLSRPLVTAAVRLDGLAVSIRRDPDGRWHAPVGVPMGPPPPNPAPWFTIDRIELGDGRIELFDSDAAGRLQGSTVLEDVTADVALLDGETRMTARAGQTPLSAETYAEPAGVRVDVRASAIRDADLPALLALARPQPGPPEPLRLAAPASAMASVRIDSATRAVSGTGAIDAPALYVDALLLEDFEAAVAIAGGRFVLHPAAFTVFEGRHRGTVVLDLTGDPARWSLDSRVEDINIGRLLAALTGRDEGLEGRGTIDLAVRGRAGDPLEAMEGTAGVVAEDGVIRGFPLLAALGRALRTAGPGDDDMRFERLSATLAIAGGVAATDDLVLQAGDVRLTAAGHVGFDRTLEFSSRVIFSAERSAGLVRSIRELALLRNPRGELEVPLRIAGTTDRPSFALDLARLLRER